MFLQASSSLSTGPPWASATIREDGGISYDKGGWLRLRLSAASATIRDDGYIRKKFEQDRLYVLSEDLPRGSAGPAVSEGAGGGFTVTSSCSWMAVVLLMRRYHHERYYALRITSTRTSGTKKKGGAVSPPSRAVTNSWPSTAGRLRRALTWSTIQGEGRTTERGVEDRVHSSHPPVGGRSSNWPSAGWKFREEHGDASCGRDRPSTTTCLLRPPSVGELCIHTGLRRKIEPPPQGLPMSPLSPRFFLCREGTIPQNGPTGRKQQHTDHADLMHACPCDWIQ